MATPFEMTATQKPMTVTRHTACITRTFLLKISLCDANSTHGYLGSECSVRARKASSLVVFHIHVTSLLEGLFADSFQVRVLTDVGFILCILRIAHEMK